MQKITPNIWCAGTAGAAGEFYRSVFQGATTEVVARYPEHDLPDFQRELAGQELVVDVTISGFRVRLINAGGEYAPTPAISFIVPIDPVRYEGVAAVTADIERMWAALSDGGEVRMPLGSYPFADCYGWVADRFGVNWQLMLTSPGSGGGPVIPQLLFTGPEPRAEAAIEFYTRLFADSGIDALMHQSAAAGDNGPAATHVDAGLRPVMFSRFTLAGQAFSAMDGGTAHDFTFTPGVSPQIDCTGQGEIDRFWAYLSTVPEAEACGWLVDRFGVSWQIVPDNMGELMARPGAYQRMLTMKKLVIADF